MPSDPSAGIAQQKHDGSPACREQNRSPVIATSIVVVNGSPHAGHGRGAPAGRPRRRVLNHSENRTSPPSLRACAVCPGPATPQPADSCSSSHSLTFKPQR